MRNGIAASPQPSPASTRLALKPATIWSRCCKTAGKRRPSIGPASSPASSARRSIGAPRPTRSTIASRTSQAKAIVFEDASAAELRQSGAAKSCARIALDRPQGDEISFRTMIERDAAAALPRAGADAWSVMLYTSGTTAKPKGVPRRQHAERAAAVAHVAQNQYGYGERTLGVMPLYHTMGVRSLLAMSLIGGAFVCLPRFEVAKRARPHRGRADHQPLSGADALSRPRSR